MLIAAIVHNDLTIVKYLLKEKKAKPNQQEDGAGLTPLHYACQTQNQEMIKLLLQYGADPSQCTDDGIFPLDLQNMT